MSEADPRVLDSLRALEAAAGRIAVALEQLAALADEALTRVGEPAEAEEAS